MKIINDTAIDAVIESLDTFEEIFDRHVDDFVKKQPVIASFLESENTGILSDEERDFLEYLALVIYKCVEKVHPNLPAVTEEQIGEAEEKNWDIMENSKGKSFSDKIDPFFENYKQEDLLAFVEDSLVYDPDDEEANLEFLTDEGREPMFITLKTIIDAFDIAIQ
jgi:hypothetical protein